jgi:two-component system OmpR family response regulator
MKVLIVEDDMKIADFLKKGLGEAGFQTQVASDGEQGLHQALHEDFNLLIVDIMLPKSDGLELVSKLRQSQKQTPVLILSAKRSVDDRVLGLQKGGDDYLTKPFAFSELLARCQALMRRYTTPESNHHLNYEDISLNLLSHEVFRSGTKLDLQAKEFSLMEYFLRNPEIVLTKTQILERVWNYNFDPQTNVVDVLVCRLRNKIDKEHSLKTIKTVRGVGYVLKKH